MRFEWPWALPVLLVVPVSVGAYLWLRHRKRKFAVRYASLSLIREALPERSSWRRHIPAVLLLVAMLGLASAGGRCGAAQSHIDRAHPRRVTVDVFHRCPA